MDPDTARAFIQVRKLLFLIVVLLLVVIALLTHFPVIYVLLGAAGYWVAMYVLALILTNRGRGY